MNPPSTDAFLDSIADRALRFAEHARRRGRRYAWERRVDLIERGATAVRATVIGSSRYETAWEWSDAGGARPRCTCPVAPECKHAFAVAVAVFLEERHRLGTLPPEWRAVLTAGAEAEWEDAAGAPMPLVPGAARRPAGIRDVAAAGAARDSRQARAARQIERLRGAGGAWDRRYALAEVLNESHGHGLSAFEAPLADILDDTDPDLMCWRLAWAIANQTDGWVPRALEAYRDRPDLMERVREREYAQMASGLIDWASHRAAAPQRALRVVLGFADHGAGTGVTLEVRMTSPRQHDVPRSLHQVHQLANEIRRDPSRLTPPQVRLLHILTEAPGLGGVYVDDTSILLNATLLHYLLDRLSNSPLATWGDDLPPALAARGGVRAGDRFRLADETVRLLPVCIRDDAGEWWVTLAVVWPDGRRQPLEDMVHVRSIHEYHPTLVLADGRFWAVSEEPPPGLLERFEQSGAFPVPRQGRRDYLERLMASFPTVREALAPHTRVHAAEPVGTFVLHEGDWLEMHLLGHAGRQSWQPGEPLDAGATLFELDPGQGWVRADGETLGRAGADFSEMPDTRRAESDGESGAAIAAPAAPAAPDGGGTAATPADGAVAASAADSTEPGGPREILLEQPDEERLAPLRQWVDLLPVHRPKSGRSAVAPTGESWRRGGWWIRLNAKTVESLAAAWERRPEGVRWYGNRRAYDLLSGARRLVPRLHIRSSGIDWLAVSAEWEAEGLELTDADLARLRRARTRFVRLGGQWVRRDLADAHDETRDLLADIGVEPGAGEQRLTVWQLAQAGPEALDKLERLGGGPEMAARIRDLKRRVAEFRGLPRVELPRGIRATLRPYQHDGLDFLAYADGLGLGAVLADDMGLGKTVQALAWIEHLRERDPDGGPVLVLCPASVVHNWAREAERFAPGLRVLLLQSGRERHARHEEIPQSDLVVTNYALFRRDIAVWREARLRAVILDEAQNVKNPDAAVTKAVLELEVPHRLALTGTPLENRALDLWSILSFVNPGYLGDRATFEDLYDRADRPAHARRLLASRLRPVLLRRLKREVEKDLPERIEEVLDCQLTRGQRQLYVAELTRARREVERLAAEPGGIARRRVEVLAALTRLRQICCHPALAGGRADLGSGKFEAAFELLDSLRAEGHKVLLFSQFVECLELLRAEMRRRGIPHHILTGATTKREQVVSAFTNDPEASVFLISLRAGGTGLNLTAASHVILFDPWWNPAVEAQAIDRTHRIGQQRTVIAFRMLTEGTIEERIAELQKRKAGLARDVLEAEGFARSLSREDLTYLLAAEGIA